MSEEGLLGQLKRFVVGDPIPSHYAHHQRLSRVTNLTVLAIRLAAIIVIVATMSAVWNVMLWLPWQVDCALATAAAFAYAYKFEREEAQ